MFNPEKRGDLIGEGYNKKVYQDHENPDKVVGILDSETETPNQIKARYYLTKILHLLFPKNIMDMHGVASQPNSYQADKGEHDELHTILNTGDDGIVSYDEAHKMVESDPELKNLAEGMDALGVPIDDYPHNFSHDSEGNILYLDTFEAWRRYDSGKIDLWFKFDSLDKALAKLPEDDRAKGEKYLSRLRALYDEEVAGAHVSK